MAVCRDRRRLEGELAVALANSNGNSSPARRLASMTSPERVEFEAGRLAQWKEEQKFGEVSFIPPTNLVHRPGKKANARYGRPSETLVHRPGNLRCAEDPSFSFLFGPPFECECASSVHRNLKYISILCFLQKIAAVEAELQNAKRDALAYKSMLEVAQRQGSVNGKAPESSDSVQTPAVEGQAGGGITAEELESAKAEAERAQRVEKQLRSQLEVEIIPLMKYKLVHRSSWITSVYDI